MEKPNEAHEKAIEALKRQVKKEQDKVAKAVELYKASKEFEGEVSKSSKGTYDYAFSQCHNLIKKLYPEVDISKVTPKVAVEMGVKEDLESPLNAAEEIAKEFGRSPIGVNTTGAITESLYLWCL